MVKHTTASLSSRALLLMLALCSFVAARDIASSTNLVTSEEAAADPNNPLHYLPTNGLTVMAVIVILVIAIPQTLFVWRTGGKFMLAMVIAEYTYAVGFALRFALRSNLDSIPMYAAYNFFVTLSPCGFIAAAYVLLGRLSRSVDGGSHVLIPPQKITKIFVLSDVATFLTQAGGGGISASAGSNASRANLGAKIFLVGLILQLVSFVFFTLVYLRFIYRMRKYEPMLWNRDDKLSWFNDWRTLAAALGISCVGIIIRSVYRCVELSQGYDGHLTRVEAFLFIFDFAPLVVAVGIYLPFWPGRFIRDDLSMRAPSEEMPLEPQGGSPASFQYKSPVYGRNSK